MKKLIKLMLTTFAIALLFPISSVEACAAFIIGRNLTTDGSTLFGRTEDYPYPPDGGRHNKNYIVIPAKSYQPTDMLTDEANGFTYPHLANEFKYTSTPDAARGDGSNGSYGAHGFNEYGVSMTATVTAIPNDKILAVDPLVKNGLAESALVDLVLPRVKTAREGIELVARVIREKGSAEGNIIVVADRNEVWYMEILSGHQYAAIKFPDDKYAIFANTYYLGSIDTTDKANVIASDDLESVAKQANSYKHVNGKFHIAKSYGPDSYAEGDRSRTYAGITLLDPATPVTYQDDIYDLLRQPTDPTRKYSLEDAFNIQRNRFEHLPQFRPDDEVGIKRQGDNSANTQATAQHKYPLGNENVIDAHVYQIRQDLPAALGGVVWLGLAQTRNTPYIPFYGNVTDTYQAFKPQSDSYDPNSWYWVAQHIDRMAMDYPNLFGKDILNKWRAYEKEEISYINNTNSHYAQLTEDAAKGLAGEITADSLARADKLFKLMKQIEAEMEEKIANSKNTSSTQSTESKSQSEESKSTESKSEEPKSEEPKSEEPKSEEPKSEEPKSEEPKSEEPKSEEPKSEEPKSEESKTEQPKSEQPKPEESRPEKPSVDLDKITAPTQKVKVKNSKALTADEKEAVKKAILAANKLPQNTEISVANDGTVSIKLADGRTKIIPASEVVYQEELSSQPTDKGKHLLPYTGTQNSIFIIVLGAVLVGSAIALLWYRRKEK